MTQHFEEICKEKIINTLLLSEIEELPKTVVIYIYHLWRANPTNNINSCKI